MLYFGGGYPGALTPPVEVVFLPPPAAVPSELAVEVPMRVATGGTTRPMTVIAAAAYHLAIMRRALVPMTKGMAERVQMPAQLTPRVTIGRT